MGRLMIDVAGNKLFECLLNRVGMHEVARLGRVLAFTSVGPHSELGLCERCVMILWCDVGAK